jgi:pyruvate decarboxylase
LALPTDLVDAYISSAPLQSRLVLDLPLNDKDAENFVLDEIVRRVDKADGDVALLVDACAIRHGVVEEVHTLMHATGFPIYSAPMGKSIVPEDYERFGGVCGAFASQTHLTHSSVDIQWCQHSACYLEQG